MPEEIHIHVPKGAKVIIHEDETESEVEREATLDDVLKELRELLAFEKQSGGVTFVPYPVYPAQPIWVVPYYQPLPLPVSPPLPEWHINPPYTVTCKTSSDTIYPNYTVNNTSVSWAQ